MKVFALLLFLLISSQPRAIADERKISPVIQQLINNMPKQKCDFDDVPYCYLFKAIVDVNDGYLRVWKRDIENNRYVAGELRRGDLVHIRAISDDKKRGYITHFTLDCMSAGCMGEIDLRYLR